MATSGGESLTQSSEQFFDFSCSNCAKDNKHTEGESFCVECNQTFCTSCLVHHNKIAIMRQHELLDQTKMATRRTQKDLVQLPTSRCTVHQGRVIDMFCGQHELVCCTVCIAEDHRNCEGIIYIPNKSKNIKTSQEFLEINTAIDAMIADIEMLKKGKKSDLERITTHHAQIQASIQNIRDQLNKHLDDLETEAKDELDRKFKVHEDEINTTLLKLENQLSEMEKAAHKLQDGQNESQVFVDLKKAKMKQTVERKLLNDVEKSVGKAGERFVPNNEIFSTLEHKSFGTFEAQKSVASVSHHGDFNVKTPADDETCWITGSCQMLDGNFVIIDFNNQKIKLLDQTYKVLVECELSASPWDLCKTRPTEIAIALYNDNKVQFTEITDKISLKGSFSINEACRGIAYHEGLLYLSLGGNKENNEGPGYVGVYDMIGKPLQEFKYDKQRRNRNLFSVPLHIVVNKSQSKLHIADRDNGIVTMNLQGTEPSKFTHPDMKDPNGFCVVDNDDLIICGFVSHNVILLNKNWEKKAILLKEEDGIKNPWSVLYDRPNSRLIVSMHEYDHIKVYKIL